MKAHEITLSDAIEISRLDANAVGSMLQRGVLHRVEAGETYIQRASFLDCLQKDREARRAVEDGLTGQGKFWEDLEEDLFDPVFVEAYIEAYNELMPPRPPVSEKSVI